jgi:hypothetical protein
MACGLGLLPAEAEPTELAIKPTVLTGEEILRRSAEVYAQASSYQDTGEVRTRFFPHNREPHETISPFTTAFVRPARFRFEFHHRFNEEQPDWHRYVVWKAEGEVQAWWSLRPTEKPPENLSQGLAKAAGVSGGSAYRIPGQLMPEVLSGRPFLARLRRVTLVDTESVDATKTYKVQGTADTLEQTLWIGQEDFLVRKIYEEHTFERFETQTTTIYHPFVNQPVPPAALAFGVEKP